MTIQDDKILNNLSSEKYLLIKQLDTELIDKNTYNEKMDVIDDQIKERQNFLLEEENKKIKSIDIQQEEIKMEIEKENKPKERTPKEGTVASNIEKALLMKTVKSFEDVAEKVAEWKEGVDKKKVIAMTKIIIREVKKGTQNRWKKYNWNNEDFSLILKEE